MIDISCRYDIPRASWWAHFSMRETGWKYLSIRCTTSVFHQPIRRREWMYITNAGNSRKTNSPRKKFPIVACKCRSTWSTSKGGRTGIDNVPKVGAAPLLDNERFCQSRVMGAVATAQAEKANNGCMVEGAHDGHLHEGTRGSRHERPEISS